MSQALAGQKVKGGTLTETGLVLEPGLEFEDWLALGQKLAKVASRTAFAIGDWLTYGQFAYGKRYEQGIEATGLSYQTLRSYAWVSGRFAPSRRRDTLSFSHHMEVAALPPKEQDHWLQLAANEQLSQKALREAMASPAELPKQAGAIFDVLRLRLEHDLYERAASVATERGLKPEEWIRELVVEALGETA